MGKEVGGLDDLKWVTPQSNNPFSLRGCQESKPSKQPIYHLHPFAK